MFKVIKNNCGKFEFCLHKMDMIPMLYIPERVKLFCCRTPTILSTPTSIRISLGNVDLVNILMQICQVTER